MGNLVIFDLTFLPGGRECDSNLLENVKIPPYAPPPPRRLDIDRCIIDYQRKGVGVGKEEKRLNLFFFLAGSALADVFEKNEKKNKTCVYRLTQRTRNPMIQVLLSRVKTSYCPVTQACGSFAV